ncbi:hypothetical protein BCIN_09g04700 [Botrytis cinerea B05.10]|uniref:Uncharacterized protein n=1 Tax=Botryotinia fuckeliana (strain B05.10) TaxID=332648 RepID=A0A384JT48_BOTFB|nr:hypothetical protein BCIN_09g04700 [Botrytis cinerea B05.10]XP_024550964.1 hypothetical protein BCIN_09g04700 [Botrytis cinerea B05.10]ATZ53671.1 hypothetical protein BCIN_09g04700 [Botrytis cinerea B05.10]ATZ53672.1 hypothetical protein BCIN_09g04700 [Botrytis cinerea B05.10]
MPSTSSIYQTTAFNRAASEVTYDIGKWPNAELTYDIGKQSNAALTQLRHEIPDIRIHIAPRRPVRHLSSFIDSHTITATLAVKTVMGVNGLPHTMTKYNDSRRSPHTTRYPQD